MSTTLETPTRRRTLDLQELSAELMRRQESKKDYVVDTRRMSFQTESKRSTLSFDLPSGEADGGTVNEHAHGQLADRLSIPKKYYDRMRADAPTLLDANVNHWFYNGPEKRLVRMLDGNVRAVLSDTYRRLDDFDLMQYVLPIFAEIDGLEFQQAALSETKLYVRAILPGLAREVKPGLGDIVTAGVALSNSEVGNGSLSVEPFVWRLACLNGMTLPDRKMRKYHLGSRLEETAEVRAAFSEETISADDNAFFMKVGDLVRNALSEVQFATIVDQLAAAQDGVEIENPVAATQMLAQSFSLTQAEEQNVLLHLAKGGDLSKFGAAQAITAAAKQTESFERQAEMEEFGGALILSPVAEWRKVAEAVAA